MGSSNSLEDGSIINAKCGKGEALLQRGTTIQKRAVHPSDTRTNTNLCLLAGQICFKNGVLYDIMLFRRLKPFQKDTHFC